jgi:hypothetical protein
MVWGQWPLLPLVSLELPVWPIITILLQLLYAYWVIRSLLQVLRVEPLTAGWKLYWLAVIYVLPPFGPLIWLFSLHNPRRFSVGSIWRRSFGSTLK